MDLDILAYNIGWLVIGIIGTIISGTILYGIIILIDKLHRPREIREWFRERIKGPRTPEEWKRIEEEYKREAREHFKKNFPDIKLPDED